MELNHHENLRSVSQPPTFGNLLVLEDRYMVPASYFKYIQTEIKPYMRNIVVTWMLEVCEEQRCEDEVFPLAVKNLDRFLSIHNISYTKLQHLAAASLLLASKLKSARPLKIEDLEMYSNGSVPRKDILDWEMLLLTTLKWDISAITPVDFIGPILDALPSQTQSAIRTTPDFMRQIQLYIKLCSLDNNFSIYSPSTIAAASIVASFARFEQHLIANDLLMATLQAVINVDADILAQCVEQVMSTPTAASIRAGAELRRLLHTPRDVDMAA